MRHFCGYGYVMSINNLIAYCKKLHSEGYTNKQIHLVTKISSSSISRILSGTTYRDVDAQAFWRDSVIEDRLHTLNVLLECHEISGGMGLDTNNKIYIQILKRVGVNFAKIKELYYDISRKALRNAWTYVEGNINDFKSESLNIATADILELLSAVDNIDEKERV
jgi:hypothetical protein